MLSCCLNGSGWASAVTHCQLPRGCLYDKRILASVWTARPLKWWGCRRRAEQSRGRRRPPQHPPFFIRRVRLGAAPLGQSSATPIGTALPDRWVGFVRPGWGAVLISHGPPTRTYRPSSRPRTRSAGHPLFLPFTVNYSLSPTRYINAL